MPMKEQDSHPIRNGIIVTVAGGIAFAILTSLWPALQNAIVWFGTKILWMLSLFSDGYQIPGWLLAILSLCSVYVVIRLFVALKPTSQAVPESAPYVEDTMHGVVWRWRWLGSNIDLLWCYCPQCDAELVYDDSSCSAHAALYNTPKKTDFICEPCGRIVRASIPSGPKSYAVGAIQREIRRRLRIKDRQSSSQ